MATLCVDAGTSIIKTVAFDDRGMEISVVRQETKVLRPRAGFSEQDMDGVWDAVASTIRRIVPGLAEPVRLLSVTAQGDGVWLVDENGRPTGPAILWNDARATAIIERWRAAGTLTEAYRRNGTQVFAGLPNGIFTWLQQHDPDRLARSHKSLCCGGWIFYNLTGRLAIDESDASVPFLDIRTRHYSPELLDLYALPWAQRLLPEVLSDEERTGELSAEAAGRLGLPPGLPVVMSLYDVASTAIGAGVASVGQGCSILGTTLCTEVVVREPQLDGTPSGYTLPFGPDLYLRSFPTLAGAEVIHWVLRQLGLREPAELSALAAGAEPGAGGLLCLPYFSPAGERVPFLETGARGSFHGLSFEHGREHLARAVFEGLSYVILDCLLASGQPPDTLRTYGLCGGGANSALWCQIIADVLGVPTFRPRGEEVGAKGALIVGLVATGQEKSFAAAARDYLQVGATFEPDAGRHARYQEGFEQFRAVRAGTVPIWQRMAAGRAS
ncbi:MAG: carbohydrate kinase [Gluconacetobacter diazotrophicus]|nr:carbohydrate kinase [Gluconacetobacter diazotrophicus]